MDRDQWDVLDLVINTLREHEKHLDGVGERMEKAIEVLEKFSTILALGYQEANTLNSIEEEVLKARAKLLEYQELGVYANIREELDVFDRILKLIGSKEDESHRKKMGL